MTSPNPGTGAIPVRTKPTLWKQFKTNMSKRFNLLSDRAGDDEIGRRIREGVELSGAMPWVLMCAILIASVGLNVNSTAVVIGAMLISPLMGPIVGIGHSLAVERPDVLRRAGVNLAISTGIGLGVSAAYFALTPLTTARSELLARTSPTLWDVIIALTGGMVGIIGATRTQSSNVIPGVAIATALMPPLCTAGFGLANGNWGYFQGASYLYFINCLFIALSTFVGCRLMQLPRATQPDPVKDRRVHIAFITIAILAALPSAYAAASLVREEVYRSRAKAFVLSEFSKFSNSHVSAVQADPKSRRIEVSVLGVPLDKAQISRVQNLLSSNELGNSTLVVHQTSRTQSLDGPGLSKTPLTGGLAPDCSRLQETLHNKELEFDALRKTVAADDAFLKQSGQLIDELKSLYPTVATGLVTSGYERSILGTSTRIEVLNLSVTQPLPDEDKKKLATWFKTKSNRENVQVVVTVLPPQEPAATPGTDGEPGAENTETTPANPTATPGNATPTTDAATAQPTTTAAA